MGPSVRIVSKDDSYLKESEQELLEPYDENNGFNIFTNNLKLRKKQRINQLDSASKKSPLKKTPSSAEAVESK